MQNSTFIKILLAFFTTLCQLLSVNAALAKSSTASQSLTYAPLDLKDLGSDLPDVGSSLFDKIFSTQSPNGKRVYEVPFPMEKLVERMKQATQIETSPQATILPFSRSLQRPGEVMDQPWEYPRLVFGLAAEEQDSPHTRSVSNKIFLGYNEKKDQMEIISFNDEAGRFEFQLVHEYSKRASVTYSPRAKCLSCHQNQAPIFSINSWADAIHPMNQDSFGVAYLLAQPEMVQTKLGVHPHEFATNGLNFPKALYKADFNNSIMNLDVQIRTANRHFEAQRVWLHGCGPDAFCRQVMLLKNFAPELFKSTPHSQHAAVQSFDRIKSQVKRNLKNYNVADDEISNRDPGIIENYKLVSKSIGGTDDFYTDIKNQKLYPKISEWLRSNNLIGKLIKGLSDLKNDEDITVARANPATPRIMSNESFINIAISTAFEHQALVNQSRYGSISLAKKLEIVQTLAEKYPDFFTARAFNVFRFENLMKQIAPELAVQSWNHLNFQQGQHELLPEEDIRTAFSIEPLNKMWNHCAACHSGKTNFPPGFLNGSEQMVTQQLRALKTKIISRIEAGDDNGMPPARHLREKFIHSGDKEVILNFIKGL